MARQPRQICLGEYYHITCRGNNRRVLFDENKDFKLLLKFLQRYRLKHHVSVFHYCLMSNHVHMLLQSKTSNDGISNMMHDLQTAYAVYFKKENKATGHIFEGRFKSNHIQTETHLLECGRYIERNPIRAGLVEHVKDYPWSSYYYYGLGNRLRVMVMS